MKDEYFKKIKKPSVTQQVIDSLTKAMIDGELQPGDKIPTELELAESMGSGVYRSVKPSRYWSIMASWKSADRREPLSAKVFRTLCWIQCSMALS